MNESNRDDGFSDAQLRELQRISQDFEKRLRNHENPKIEDQLEMASRRIREALFADLVGIEVGFRKRVGLHPTETEYQIRFPGSESIIRQVFAAGELHSSSIDLATEGITLDNDPIDVDRKQGTETTGEFAGASRGVQIGPYKLLLRIGEGGMGSVWMAEQSKPVRRKVAVKIIKAGMDTREVIARFEAERQALALMNHPNIAKVLDAGETNQGRPFFVMELVKGKPITKFCDSSKMRPEQRLKLFTSVCRAVQHAHQKGIIHRDIKPSNVLVAEHDGEPVVKVIDFGLAKATGQSLTEKTMFTAMGQMVGTPTYMSPEQAEGGIDIDTRTDVYSLGVLLYELLTGVTPIDAGRIRSAGFAEIQRMIRDETPPAMSQRLSSHEQDSQTIASNRATDSRRLTQILRGDLDLIVMKALEKQRSRRYETPSSLAADIDRFINSDAIEARPPSASYRLKKLIRRNKTAVLTSAIVSMALLAGTVVSAWQAVRATRARNELAQANIDMQARYDLAVDAIETYHTGVSEDFLLQQEQFKSLRDRLLNSASEFYEKLGALLKDDTDLSSRRALLQANFQVAELAFKVGRKEDALNLHRRVLTGREAIVSASGQGSDTVIEWCRSLMAVGEVLQQMGETDEARKMYEQARAAIAGKDDSPPKEQKARLAFVDTEYRLGRLLGMTGQISESLAMIQDARNLQEILAKAAPEDMDQQVALAKLISIEGILHGRTGKPDEALASYEAARAIFQKLADSDPGNTRFQSELALSHANAASVLIAVGRSTEALDAYKAALEIRERLVEANPAVSEFQNELARGITSIGFVYGSTGKPDEALESFKAARDIQLKLVEANPSVTRNQIDLARNLDNIGIMLNQAGNYAEALTSYEAARVVLENLVENNPTVPEYQYALARIHNNLGLLPSSSGKPVATVDSLKAARDIQQKLVNDNPDVTQYQRDLARSHLNIGALLAGEGDPAEALASYDAATTIQTQLIADNPTVTEFQSDLANAHNSIGLFFCETAEHKKALESFEAARAIQQKLTENNPQDSGLQRDLYASLTNIAYVLRKDRRNADSLENYNQAIELSEPVVRKHPDMTSYQLYHAYALQGRGCLRVDMGDPTGAADDVRSALDFWEDQPGRDGEGWFSTACCHATLSVLAGREGTDIPATEAAVEAKRAMDALRKAVELGYVNPQNYRTETALASLRETDEFKTLLKDIAMPEGPKN